MQQQKRRKDTRPTRHVYTVSSFNKHEIKNYIEKWQPLLGENDIILIKSAITYGGKMKDHVMSKNPCDIPNRLFPTIDWQGNVSPCNLDTNMELIVGSILNEPLADIVEGARWNEMIEKIKNRMITPCKNCFDSNNRTKNRIIKHDTDITGNFLDIWE